MNKKEWMDLAIKRGDELDKFRARIASIAAINEAMTQTYYEEKSRLKGEIERLQEWQRMAFQVYPNIDLDIEALEVRPK